MKFSLIRSSFLLLFYSLSICVSAQQEDVFVAEVGFNTGGSFYIGDANSKMFNNTQIAYGPFIRYNVDPRFSVKAEMSLTHVQHLTAPINYQMDFTNSIKSLDVCAEYNFFDLEKLNYKLFSKTFSPYIFGGGGAMIYVNHRTNRNNPYPMFVFGVGMKYMVSKRINLNFQWSNRLLMGGSGDTMEGLTTLDHGVTTDSQATNGSNIFNNDLLSTMTIGISFNIWKKQCDCMNIHKTDNRRRK
jgi:hypothetical protein